ncbi:MAG: hypothetical protein KC910_05625, partial [Candidatus Eremiobacteraeota bacterium]|nr:hypothetical protein [Candidatus Eremiobacteraeota bacterium]
MFCVTCDETFSSVHNRCPKCGAWLRTSKPESEVIAEVENGSTVAVAKSGKSKKVVARIEASPSLTDPQWRAPGPDWAGAPQVKTPVGQSWLGEEPDTEWGKPNPRIRIPEDPELLDESWVDEEVDRPDSEESDRTVTAEAIASDPQATWLVALLLALVAIGGFYLMRPSSRPPAAVQSPEVSTQEHFDFLMSRAREAAGRRDYEVAALQVASALEGFAGDPVRKSEARAEMAGYFAKAGQYDKALSELEDLAAQDASYSEQLTALKQERARSARQAANQLLSQSEEAFRARDYSTAISQAERALKLYRANQGSDRQMSQALGLMGISLARCDDLGRARDCLTQAQRLAPQQRFGSELARVESELKPRPKHTSRPHPAPTRTVEVRRPSYPKKSSEPEETSPPLPDVDFQEQPDEQPIELPSAPEKPPEEVTFP